MLLSLLLWYTNIHATVHATLCLVLATRSFPRHCNYPVTWIVMAHDAI